MREAPRRRRPSGPDCVDHGAEDEQDATELAPVFAALSDPVRLRLLSIVASEGEVCSCNLEGPLAKSQPTISHHTRVLAEAGSDRRREARPLDVVARRPRADAEVARTPGRLITRFESVSIAEARRVSS